jgi:hypothetical protein
MLVESFAYSSSVVFQRIGVIADLGRHRGYEAAKESDWMLLGGLHTLSEIIE